MKKESESKKMSPNQQIFSGLFNPNNKKKKIDSKPGETDDLNLIK